MSLGENFQEIQFLIDKGFDDCILEEVYTDRMFYIRNVMTEMLLKFYEILNLTNAAFSFTLCSGKIIESTPSIADYTLALDSSSPLRREGQLN